MTEKLKILNGIEVLNTKGDISIENGVLKIVLTSDEAEKVDTLVKKNYSQEDYEKYIQGIATAGHVSCLQKHKYAADWAIGYPGFKKKGTFYLLDRYGKDEESNRWFHSWVTLWKERSKTVIICRINQESLDQEKLRLVGINCKELEFLCGIIIR